MTTTNTFTDLLAKLRVPQPVQSTTTTPELQDLFQRLKVQPPEPETTTTALNNPIQALPATADKLYHTFSEAELTGVPSNKRWIRTKSKPAGDTSTAFGPVQITSTLAEDYLTRKGDLFNATEKKFLKRFIQQGEKFKLMDQGKISDPKYDYGGPGSLVTAEDRQNYVNVSKKMLLDTYIRNNKDIHSTWKEWRFGPSKKGTDERYQKLITAHWNKFHTQ